MDYNSGVDVKKKLVVLDSHAILHRAYHALPDFSTSKGEPTGALYGLVAMLLKAVKDLKPEYIVACRDLPGKTHRHDAYEKYKATRAKADDALIVQLGEAPKVFAAFGIPLYAASGFEADDCIGTIVRTLEKRNDVTTVIVTGDMDTLQLVGPRASVYTLRKGLNDTVLYDADRVRERYGFGPEHITDYKALRGDPSDNIPGVRGIGEKTAEELIVLFGSVENLYAALTEDEEGLRREGVRARTVELLKAGEKNAAFSKELATIRRDAPIDFVLPEVPWRLEDHAAAIVALCDELEFRSIRERVKVLLGRTKVASGESGAPAQTDSLFAHSGAPEDVDPRTLKETSVALWLVRSTVTNPTQNDVLAFADSKDFQTARAAIFKALGETGRLRDVFEKIERPLIPIIEAMNCTGVLLDSRHLRELSREYTKELHAIEKRVYKSAGREFSINSPKQLGEVLYKELKLSLPRQKKTPGGALTTREEELQKMRDQHPIIADVLEYRELQKLLSTYIDKMPGLVGKDGRLHAEFLQAGSSTGRMASQNPGLQNIPIKTERGKRIRSAFVAPPGFVIASLDYSQIELRVAAGLSGDKKLIEAFREGRDIHALVASAVFGVPPESVNYEMRRRAKVINFGILYGMGVSALRQSLGPDVARDEAAKFLSDYFANFSGLARYIEETKKSAARLGYTETLFGRRRYFPEFKSALPQVRSQAERMAVNAPVQGTASDIIKRAMIDVDEALERKGWREKARLVMQIHDELVYEIEAKETPTIVRVIKGAMERAIGPDVLSGVPIVVDAATGKNWGELKDIESTH